LTGVFLNLYFCTIDFFFFFLLLLVLLLNTP
jgi:hypothetical protein